MSRVESNLEQHREADIANDPAAVQSLLPIRRAPMIAISVQDSPEMHTITCDGGRGLEKQRFDVPGNSNPSSRAAAVTVNTHAREISGQSCASHHRRRSPVIQASSACQGKTRQQSFCSRLPPEPRVSSADGPLLRRAGASRFDQSWDREPYSGQRGLDVEVKP